MLSLRSLGRRWIGLAVGLLLLALAPSADAADKRAEAAARATMKAATLDYSAGDYNQGILRLRKAGKACGQCTAEVRGELLRDTGVLQLANGETEKADASFLEALLLDASLDFSPAYDKPDLRSEWEAVKDEVSMLGRSQPSGDFITTPPQEQAVRTALPIYVEYGGAATTVVAKYKPPGGSDYKKMKLTKIGAGWGGELPCTEMARGVVRYYVQGFDENETPVAITGDPKHPLYVPIHWTLTNPAPHLPGKEPPGACGSAAAATVETPVEAPGGGLDNGEVCEADAQCQSQRCANGRCAPSHSPRGASGGYVHFWFGVSGSVDLTVTPSGSDVCLLTPSAVPANSQNYYCTTPGGSDFPSRASPTENATLVKGQAGQASGGFQSGDVRVLLTFDYAINPSLLVGARFGFVFAGYPGQAAAHNGNAFAAPLDIEIRGTYLFGNRPLARSGFAPLVYVGGGVAEFDAGNLVGVTVNNVPGPRAMVAWKTGGPGFALLGGGLRYAFSPRVAFLSTLKFTGAFGGGGFYPAMAPELALQYGF